MTALLLASIQGLLLAVAVLVAVLCAGCGLWWLLARRRPGTAELLGPVFYLGSMALTLPAAGLVVGRAMDGWMPWVLWLVLCLGPGAFVLRRAELREAVREAGPRLWTQVRAQPLLGILCCGIWALEFLVCLAPNTAWDAHTLHYGILEQFRQTGSVGVQGRSTAELFHLNSEVLNVFWFGLAGERAANLYYWMQCGSLAATVHTVVCRVAPTRWGATAGLLALWIPVTVHQSAGGWVDTLLVQGTILAYLAYEDGRTSSRLGTYLLAGMYAGYAWGIKQSAPAMLLPLALLALWELVRGPRRAGALVMGMATLLVAAPWVARTWLVTGNPLFPALPAWTRLEVVPDTSEGTALRTPLPFGPLHMLIVHIGGPRRWLDDRMPPWVLAMIVCGLLAYGLTKGRSSVVGRWWFATVLGFGTAYAFFFGNPRYGLYAYVFGLIASAGACGRKDGRCTRWVAIGALLPAALLAGAIAGAKVWNRRDVLLGRIDALAHLTRTYPHLRLIEEARPQFQPGDAVVVFNALQYHHGLPTYDADPRGSSIRLKNWAFSSTSEVETNLQELGVRWIVVPYGYGRLSTGVGLWAARRLRRANPTNEEVVSLVKRRFPEWPVTPSTTFWPDPTMERFSRVVDRLEEMHARLTPAGATKDWILYRYDAASGPANRDMNGP